MNCNKIIHHNNCNTIIQEDSYDNNYAFVYVLQLNQTTGTTSQVFIKTSEDQQIIFDLGFDGFYTLVTMKVPKDPQADYYYFNDSFYHQGQEVELQELIELNPQVTGIDVTYDYYFQTCRLKRCFINMCYEVFDTQHSVCKNLKLDQNLVYNRDLVWSALNAIKFMVEVDQYEEAERLLERIMGCNGLCKNSCPDSHSNSKCGCK